MVNKIIGLEGCWCKFFVLCINFKIGDKLKQNGGEMTKILFDRRFNIWYTINENGGKGKK